MTSRDSINGIPARTNADSCREKCISSSCFSFFRVISNCRTLRLGRSVETLYPCSTSPDIAVLIDVAVVVPLTDFPASVVAWYRNLPITSSARVDVSQNLGDRRDVVRHELDPGVTKGPHSLGHGELLDLVVPSLARDQLTHRLAYDKQFVDADPILESGLEAEIAALTSQELVFRPATEVEVELDLFVGRLIRHGTRAADPTHEPLSDDPDDRRGHEERLDAKVEEPLKGAG